MSKSEAIAKIRAAAWLIVSALDWRIACDLLRQVASEIEAEQWK